MKDMILFQGQDVLFCICNEVLEEQGSAGVVNDDAGATAHDSLDIASRICVFEVKPGSPTPPLPSRLP